MSTRKFVCRHKYGKKRRKSLIQNVRRVAERSRCTEDELQIEDERQQASSDGAAEVRTTGLGLTAPSTSALDPPDVGRVRVDTVIRSPSEINEGKKRADAKVRELASTAATQRKSDLLAASDSGGCPLDDTSFTVVCLELVNTLLQHLHCKICGGNAKICQDEREYGLAVKLLLVCSNCGDKATVWSSPRVNGDAKVNPFAINILAARAMQATGNRQTALNDIFAIMNISHRGLHTKTWQAYQKLKLTPAAARAAEKQEKVSAESVRKLYSELSLDNPGNIAVSYDGSWMTRGHSSHIGVGAVIELFSGLVLDYVVLSNFCAGCERGPKAHDPHYEEWKASHVCQKNTDKKSGEMEVEAGLILFRRSWEKHHLRYTTVLSDGDSRTFLALKEAEVYGYIDIQKEECVNHVQKRMGTALRNLLTKHKGCNSKPLGGKGRLTGDLVNKLSSYYGWAIKSHSDDIEGMHKAVMATYHHVTSNDSLSNHSLCPTGPNSWCQQNAAKAKGEPAPRHRYNLPDHVAKALLPIYERLSDKKLLERCVRGKTQNSNESLHSLIWALAPKERHASLFAIEAAVAEAVMNFNAGRERTSAGILHELSMNPGQRSTKRMREKDERRSVSSARKRASADNVQQTLKKRHKGGSDQSDYAPGAY